MRLERNEHCRSRRGTKLLQRGGESLTSLRRAAKKDANEPEVIKALKAAGVQVEQLGFPVDLLVWARLFCPHCKAEITEGKVLPVEVKAADGRLTAAQTEFIARWPGPVPVVRGPQEALQAVLGEAMS